MNVDELMAEMGWVRRLARGLLRDSDAANDIAQDAWLVASEHAPEDGRPLRPWLHRVVLNLVRMRVRSGGRGAAREASTEPDDSMPSAAELVERVETQRVLGEEVIALREPYRSTILLHYVEGLSSAEIARRLGIPSATVRQRLKHALDELRDRLRARADGPKQGWLAALVPLAKVGPKPALAVGTLVMKKVIAIVAVLGLLLLGGGVAWRVVRHRGGTAGDADPRGQAQRALAWTQLTTTIADRQVTLPGWFAQAGAPSRRVAGKVIFAGAPVAAAVVRLGVIATNTHVPIPAMTPGPPFIEVAKRVTDARGVFDFGALPAAMFVVSAEADGKAPVSVGIAVADPKQAVDHLVLVLGGCTTRVLGTVRDTTSPIARARLKIAGLAGPQTDDKGRFDVCMPPAKYPNIRVEADGYGSVNVQVPAMYGEIHRDFVLVPEAAIEGVVVDQSGNAAAGAAVSAWPALADAQDEASGMQALADGQGRFRIAGLAPTKYGLSAAGEQGGSSDHPLIVAAAGTVTRGVKLVIASRARLRGHVVMGGAPVEGAHVGVEHDGAARGPTTIAVSQADGSFMLDGAQMGTARLVAEPYEIVSPSTLTVRGDIDNLIVDVAAKASAQGRVTRHGRPVADARIELLPGDEVTTSDSDGHYVLEGLPAGNFDLYASNPQAFTTRHITLVAGEPQAVDLELESGGEVVGTVVDQAGASVSGVLVRLISPADGDQCRSFTDARGAFDCATLAGQRDYRVAVFPNASEGAAYAPATGAEFSAIHVEDGNTIVRDIKLAILHDELAIRGKVIDDTGTTMPDARVVVVAPDESMWGDPTRTRAGDDGGFIIEGLAPGHYDLRARMADGSVGDVKRVAAGASGVTITLVRPGSIEGSLFGFATPPVVVAAIGTWVEHDIHEGRVDADHFTITGLKPGSYTVQAIVDGVQIDGTTVDVRSSSSVQATLHAGARTTVVGRVVELGTDLPLANMTCRAALAIDQREGISFGPAPAARMTDASGQFTLDAPVGRTRVTCDPADSAHSSAGEVLDVPVSGARIDLPAVKVVAPPGNPGFVCDPTLVPPTVLRVIRTSPMIPGDTVVAVDGVDVSNMVAGIEETLVRNHRPGTTATLSVLRGGQALSIRVTLK